MAADQALTFAQKAGASMYVETSAKISRQTVVAAFELAATVAAVSRTQHISSSSILGALDTGGLINILNKITDFHSEPTDSQLSTPSPKSKAIKKQRFSSSSASTEESPSPDSSLDRTTTSVEPTAIVKVWDPFQDAHSTKSSSLREDLRFPLISQNISHRHINLLPGFLRDICSVFLLLMGHTTYK